jgi:hypothetical protein
MAHRPAGGVDLIAAPSTPRVLTHSGTASNFGEESPTFLKLADRMMHEPSRAGLAHPERSSAFRIIECADDFATAVKLTERVKCRSVSARSPGGLIL